MLKLVVKVNRAESAHQLAATVPDIQLRSARPHHSHTPDIPHLSSGLISPASTSKMRPASVWLLAAACHVSPGYEYHVYLGPRSGEPVTNFWQSTGAELDT